MKKKLYNKLGMGVIALIVLSFAFTGIFSGVVNVGGAGSIVYKVGDYEITHVDYQKFQIISANLIKNEDEKTAEKIEDYTEELIHQRYSVLSHIKKQNIEISDKEVFQEISKQENFKKQGKFSKELYFEYLEFTGVKANDFEDKLREDLLIGKFFELYSKNDYLTEADYSFIDNMKAPIEVVFSDLEMKEIVVPLSEFISAYPDLNVDEKNKEEIVLNNHLKISKYKLREIFNYKEKAKEDYELFLKNAFYSSKIEEFKKIYPLQKI